MPTTGDATTTPPFGAVASLLLCVLLSTLGMSIAYVALPTLAITLRATLQEIQWIVLGYLLTITTCIVSVGRLGDLVSRRRLLVAGISVFTTGAVACTAASSLSTLVVARMVQGLGAAVMAALAIALATDIVPPPKRGSAMGWLGASASTGTALGLLAGGLMDDHGWRAIFALQIPPGLIAAFLARRYLPADRAPKDPAGVGFDALGTLLLALTLGAYALAMTLGDGNIGMLNIGLLVAAVAGGASFWAVEMNAAAPLIRLAMFSDRMLRVRLIANALVATVLMATLVVGPFFLSLALGLEPAAVGIVMSAGPIVASIAGVSAGRVVDRWGTRRPTLLGLQGLLLGSLGLSVVAETAGVGGYLVLMGMVTAHYTLFRTANNTAVMHSVGPHHRGVVSGLLNLSRNLGHITGASVMGALFAFACGTPDLATAHRSAIATGTGVVFAVSTALIAIALVAVMRARPPIGSAP